jgi:hypothetical protein
MSFVCAARPLAKALRWEKARTKALIFDVAVHGEDFRHRSPQSRPSTGLYQEMGTHLWYGAGHPRGNGLWKVRFFRPPHPAPLILSVH